MDGIQSIFQSRTVWANVVGLLALAGAFFGVPFEAGEQERLVEACLQLVAGGGFVASTVFRVMASRRIAR